MAEVLMSLEQEAVLDAVGAKDGEATRTLLRVHHLPHKGAVVYGAWRLDESVVAMHDSGWRMLL